MNLKLRNQDHPIVVAPNAIQKLIPFLKKNKVDRVLMIADARLVEARKSIADLFAKTKIAFNEIEVQAGEGLKDFKVVYPIYAELLKHKLNRDSVVLALGGGSVGDAAGFVAATYLRGIRWVSLPTTLLAQVDSGVGGKTGVNHEADKNLIGSFHQPSLVLCDTQFLNTLSNREVASGLGEMVKYAITYDRKFFDSIDKNLVGLLKLNPKLLKAAISQSLSYKVRAVQKDEYDRKGTREVLNFGHTFGHALESITRYETYQHGEAVVWGMRFAIHLSEIRGHLKAKDSSEILGLLNRIPTPALPSHIAFNEILNLIQKDKKASNQGVRFVLLKKIGQSVSDAKVTETNLKEALARLTS